MLLDLPTELLWHITDFLEPCDLNALLRSARPLACILTGKLYDVGLNVEIVREYEPPETTGPISRLRGTFDPRSWNCVSTWKSEFISDYLAGSKVTRTFQCPDERDWTFSYYGKSMPWPTREHSLLYIMVSVQNTEMLKILLARGLLEQSPKFHEPDSPLGMAVKRGYESEAEILLNAGANVFNVGRFSILEYAALQTSERLARRLAQAVRESAIKAADSDCVHEYAQRQISTLILGENNVRDGALLMAVSHRHAGIVKIFLSLVERDAIFQKKELILDAISYPYNLEIIRFLVEAGADIFPYNNMGYTPLESIEREYRFGTRIPVSRESDMERARLILQADPYIWPADSLLCKLWKIARGGRIECGQLTLLNRHMNKEDGALHYNPGDRGCLDIHSLCDNEWNEGSSRNLTEMLQLLLDAGADASAVNDMGESLLCVAIRCRQTEMVRLIVRYTGGQSPDLNNAPSDIFELSVKEGNQPMIEYLLEMGVQNILSISQSSLLHIAAKRPGHEAIIKVLVDAGYSVDSFDDLGRTPLHIAVMWQDTNASLIKAFIDAGCNALAQDKAGKSVLESRNCGYLNFHTLRYLVQGGADLHMYKNGSLSCHAGSLGDNEVVDIFREFRLTIPQACRRCNALTRNQE